MTQNNQRELIILAQKVFEAIRQVAQMDVEIAELDIQLKGVKINGKELPNVSTN